MTKDRPPIFDRSEAPPRVPVALFRKSLRRWQAEYKAARAGTTQDPPAAARPQPGP